VAQTTAGVASGLFEVERHDSTLIVVPNTDLRELDRERIEVGAISILQLVDASAVQNIVLDFRRAESYGSAAVAVFLKLWKRLRERNGRMAFCNLSSLERKRLRLTSLDRLWLVCSD
jgi:anti-anti-sigma factor